MALARRVRSQKLVPRRQLALEFGDRAFEAMVSFVPWVRLREDPDL